MSHDAEPTRREALLADAALGWVDDADRAELAALLQDPAAQRELAELERAAALGGVASDEAVPAPEAMAMLQLAARMHGDAAAFFARERQAAAPRSARLQPLRLLPWLLAAATIALLLFPHEPAPLAPAAARDALLRQPASNWVRWPWQAGAGAPQASVQGDVVWSVGRDEGYLRLRGLPPLDEAHRYQLWIVDSSRQGPPVDGGLLAVVAGADEVVVPVRARLPVGSEAAFVLTVEDAAGVVVSAQKQVVAIAKP